MHRFTVDYSKGRPRPRVLMNRGFFLNGLPRLILLCRLTGHRPVVDGYDSQYGDDRARWVICDRCGIRPEPQGSLDPDTWNLGQPYTGEFNHAKPLSPMVRKQLDRQGLTPRGAGLPGSWPANPTSDIGSQVIIGRSSGLGVGVKVGSNSSEQCLAANLRLGPIGAVYVHTEDHGRVIQRRLNSSPDLSSESREIGLGFNRGRLSWTLWAPRNEWKPSDPKWMRGSIPIDPRHYILGPVTNERVHSTDKVPAIVHMPDGDSYDVTVRLEQWAIGRKRGRTQERWTVDWDCKDGIPIRNNSWKGDEALGGNFPIDGITPDNPQWPQVVCAAIAQHCTEDRARYNYQPTSA